MAVDDSHALGRPPIGDADEPDRGAVRKRISASVAERAHERRMEDPPEAADGCPVCGEPVDPATADEPYCSSGCRQIDETLAEPAVEEHSGDELPDDSAPAAVTEGRGDVQRTFFRIDGMHSAACEAYLESRAEALDGVRAATASYVTETVRVEHDGVPDDELRDALSPLGYDAYLRTDAEGSQRATTDTPRRSREMAGMRKERSDQALSFRYVGGVVFGTFLLIPYAVLVYPAHLAALLDVAFLDVYQDTLRLQGETGLQFLRFYSVLTGLVLAFTGMPVLRGAYVAVRTRRPNTDLLVAITALAAYCYGIASILTGGNDVFFDLTIVIAAAVTGVAVYETSVKREALERLTDLTVSQVDHARRQGADGSTEMVPIEALQPGDRVIVAAGERIPVDGTLLDQSCTVDESVVTGESVPVRREPGDAVVGGAVVTNDAAVLEVGADRTSGVERLTESVWNIQSSEHGVQRRADRIAGLATPLLLIGALAAAVGAIALGWAPGDAVLAALAVLLVASPWALGIATPLSVASAIEAATERGIVVFDETIFERLRDVDVVVFDKTGTLTTGSMSVLESDAPEGLLADVAALEERASHPAANAVAQAFGGSEGPTADGGSDRGDAGATAREVSEFASHANGVHGVVDGREVAAGSLEQFAELGWTVDADVERRADEARGVGQLPVLVGAEGHAAGIVIVGDDPREGWDATLDGLAAEGVEVVVLTGDDEEATAFFRQHDAVEHVFAGVRPAGKTAAIRRLRTDRSVAMVGDGTNDAPALAAADLGISLGSGTALAADAADLAIATDDLTLVETAFSLADAAGARVRQNAALALSYNAIAIPVALAGLLNPVTAMGATAVMGGLLAANTLRGLLPAGE